ncbi:hypothetical protein L345_10032, partial [Ophiophagus hannah]
METEAPASSVVMAVKFQSHFLLQLPIRGVILLFLFFWAAEDGRWNQKASQVPLFGLNKQVRSGSGEPLAKILFGSVKNKPVSGFQRASGARGGYFRPPGGLRKASRAWCRRPTRPCPPWPLFAKNFEAHPCLD